MSQLPRYLPHGQFHAELHQRVAEYFSSTGKPQQDVPGMFGKTLFIFAWLIGSWVLAVFVAQTWWQVVLAAISIGTSMAFVGFNVQHDGGHKGYSRHKFLNALTASGLDFIGGSSYIWHWKHNIFHHSNPNMAGLDADIDLQPLCRLSPVHVKKPWQRFQHFYIWGLYSLLAMKWMVDDVRDFTLGNIGGQKFPRPRGWKLVHMVGFKLFFVAWSMVIPALFHPVLNVVGVWVLASFVVSLLLSMTFQLAHVVEGVSFPALEGPLGAQWAAHQVEATCDFAPKSAFLTWALGGLNFQIEHHLFPNVCHMHLPALAPIVKETCEKFGVRYRVNPSAWAALLSHARWLKQLGRAPAYVSAPSR